MQGPVMFEPRTVARDTTLLGAYLPVPGLGVLPANAFLIDAEQPVLVDAGVVAMREAFVESLEQAIDLDDLRWLWLTHVDADHIGAVTWLLERLPHLRLVTSFLGMGKLGLYGPLAPDRVYLINPGQELDVGDRKLLAVRPPAFDAPETTGLFDRRSGNLFSSDCFGGVLQAPAESAADIASSALSDGIVTWTSIDAPWLRAVRETEFEASVAVLEDLKPEMVLSSHLPPASGQLGDLVRAISAARHAAPFAAPDQAALEQMLSGA